MGALVGGAFERVLRVGERGQRVLVAGGAAAGLATAFGAPLGGAVFILEEVLQRFDGPTTIAVLGATGAATAVFQAMLGTAPEFSVHDVARPPGVALLLYLAFGLAVGAVGALYNRLVLAGLDLDARLTRIPPEVRAAAVGAAVGAVAFAAPGLVGGGEAQVQDLLGRQVALGAVVVLGVVRFLLGPLSYAVGTPGGLFAPVLAVGAALGAAVGEVLHSALPQLVPDATAFTVVGLVAFFTATVRAPVTGIALIVEMTAVGSLFMPMLVAAFGAFAAATVLGSAPIYDALRERGARRPHR
jgi:CIC family chloride channel protein